MADNTPDTPSKIARAFAEHSIVNRNDGNYGAAKAEREIANTFALVAIAEALEARNK